MSKGDEYVKVRVIFVRKTNDAVLVSKVTNDVNEPVHWIPLSLLHAADESRLNNSMATEVVEFRMRAWKAERLDL